MAGDSVTATPSSPCTPISGSVVDPVLALDSRSTVLGYADMASTQTVVVYSQVWEDFTIDNVEFAVGTIAPNPDLPVSCGIDVTVVLDESGSIEDASAID